MPARTTKWIWNRADRVDRDGLSLIVHDFAVRKAAKLKMASFAASREIREVLSFAYALAWGTSRSKAA